MQQNQCFNFALKEGYNVSGIYIDDGYTAKNTNRPKFQQLLTDIKSKKSNINAVIVWRCDRMVRNNGIYHSTIVPKFAKYGVLLLSATENNDINNPYGRYIRNTQINNAELESELTSIRTIQNLKEKARQGYFPGAIPPVGYIREKIDGKKIIIPDKEKAPYLREVF
ncbi:MAG: recombinase family protein [Candidatus Gastranaerophilales bacterium]|nr:recombinase family protein [Candidatus Gastranaerophilales bacterium]